MASRTRRHPRAAAVVAETGQTPPVPPHDLVLIEQEWTVTTENPQGLMSAADIGKL